MVKLIAGLSGTGKTKEMLNEINEAVAREPGSLVCIGFFIITNTNTTPFARSPERIPRIFLNNEIIVLVHHEIDERRLRNLDTPPDLYHFQPSFFYESVERVLAAAHGFRRVADRHNVRHVFEI